MDDFEQVKDIFTVAECFRFKKYIIYPIVRVINECWDSDQGDDKGCQIFWEDYVRDLYIKSMDTENKYFYVANGLIDKIDSSFFEKAQMVMVKSRDEFIVAVNQLGGYNNVII